MLCHWTECHVLFVIMLSVVCWMSLWWMSLPSVVSPSKCFRYYIGGAVSSHILLVKWVGWQCFLSLRRMLFERPHNTRHDDIHNNKLIFDTQHKWHIALMKLSITALYCCAECRVWFIVMLNVIMLNVFMLSDVSDLLLCWMSLCWVTCLIYCYAECLHAECRDAECRGALRANISWWSNLLGWMGAGSCSLFIMSMDRTNCD
jgi:hypothetical protein